MYNDMIINNRIISNVEQTKLPVKTKSVEYKKTKRPFAKIMFRDIVKQSTLMKTQHSFCRGTLIVHRLSFRFYK